MKKISILTVILLTGIFTNAQIIYLKAVLSGASEVPPNASAASGVVIVKYNDATNYLELFGNYMNLSATISGSHIHGAATVTGTAGVVVPLTNTGGTTGTLSGTATLTTQQEADLLAGLMYVNVHSTGTYAAGEIRGQLTTTTAGQTDFLTATLQGSQEVPPNPSTATGRSFVLLDKGTNMVYLTGNYSGLSAAISGSHIHLGGPGTNGSVIVPLTNSGGTAGSMHAAASVSDAQELSISTGGTYVNVHSTGTYAAGEIRGQLTNTQLIYFGGTLAGANEVPPNSSAATGTVIVRYNPETNFLELVGDYQNLSNTISGSHIHGAATVTGTAGVVVPLTNTGGTTGTLSGTATLTAQQESDLLGGLMYVNVHSSGTYAGGEIRVQLFPATIGRTLYLTGNLQGSQEVPPNASGGTGSVTTLLDQVTGQVYVTGSFSGLGSNAISAHIHQAPPGTNGSVIVPLTVSGTTSGTVTGSGTLTQDQRTAMANGMTYVNVHSVLIPSGELRAQLGNLVLVLPVKLTYFNGFKERDQVSLVWTSAQEINLQSYEIEQQHTDTHEWIKKGTVAAKGGTSPASYRFSDLPTIGKSPVVLYRLKMIDLDGKISYSNVVKVNFQTGRGNIVIVSNPVQGGTLRYSLTGLSAASDIEASIIDYSGRLVLKTKASSLINNEINVSHLPSGMYRLVVRVNHQEYQQSFLK